MFLKLHGAKYIYIYYQNIKQIKKSSVKRNFCMNNIKNRIIKIRLKVVRKIKLKTRFRR